GRWKSNGLFQTDAVDGGVLCAAAGNNESSRSHQKSSGGSHEVRVNGKRNQSAHRLFSKDHATARARQHVGEVLRWELCFHLYYGRFRCRREMESWHDPNRAAAGTEWKVQHLGRHPLLCQQRRRDVQNRKGLLRKGPDTRNSSTESDSSDCGTAA